MVDLMGNGSRGKQVSGLSAPGRRGRITWNSCLIGNKKQMRKKDCRQQENVLKAAGEEPLGRNIVLRDMTGRHGAMFPSRTGDG